MLLPLVLDRMPTSAARLLCAVSLEPLPLRSIWLLEIVWLMPNDRLMPMFSGKALGATVLFSAGGTRRWLLVIVVPLKAVWPPAPLLNSRAMLKSKICRLEMVQFWLGPPLKWRKPGRCVGTALLVRAPGPWIVAP